jgi:histidinol phosphatase-like PHP family hydrolase
MPDAPRQFSQVDLHFHAGLERETGKTLVDYVGHAWQTGRRYLGITDHVDLYIGPDSLNPDRCYPAGLQGLEEFKREFLEVRASFAEMRLFFAPEYYHDCGLIQPAYFNNLDVIPGAVTDMADYIICDLGIQCISGDDIPSRTQMIVELIQKIQRFAKWSGKPTYIAHPFRDIADRVFSSPGQIEPGLLLKLKAPGSIMTEKELGALFQVDLRRLAQASIHFGIPLEINGVTQMRIRDYLPEAFPAYLQAFKVMADEGARFVCGSDQHQLENFHQVSSWHTPLKVLGMDVIDSNFYQRIGVDLSSIQD